ncbi:MAG: hypothetical protein ACPG5P_00145 [Saprospiraceae bacterium]
MSAQTTLTKGIGKEYQGTKTLRKSSIALTTKQAHNAFLIREWEKAIGKKVISTSFYNNLNDNEKKALFSRHPKIEIVNDPLAEAKRFSNAQKGN